MQGLDLVIHPMARQLAVFVFRDNAIVALHMTLGSECMVDRKANLD